MDAPTLADELCGGLLHTAYKIARKSESVRKRSGGADPKLEGKTSVWTTAQSAIPRPLWWSGFTPVWIRTLWFAHVRMRSVPIALLRAQPGLQGGLPEKNPIRDTDSSVPVDLRGRSLSSLNSQLLLMASLLLLMLAK